MITEKTIYICDDGMRFDNPDEARDYNEDYNRLKFVFDRYLGEPLKLPGFCEGYCLDTLQHTKEGILYIVTELCNVVNLHNIMYKENMTDMFKNTYTNIITGIKELQNETENYKINRNFSRIIDELSRWAICTYEFKDEYFMNFYKKTLIYKMLERLKNTSYVTGIEYPESSSCNWIFNEDKWDDFVKAEKEYLAQGCKYR